MPKHPIIDSAEELLNSDTLAPEQAEIVKDYLDSIAFHTGLKNHRRVDVEIDRLARILSELP
jgi:hypothetical protein